ncbi:IQ calmodulin-binding motif containing protein [Novymonas esmeraldas]|uniref:IQ calmodulin-binding motif containing protein n=1 Tax=Novymonas esmeraldas TaxID=1808958 RepID=A0AAW0ERY1_9TRYP
MRGGRTPAAVVRAAETVTPMTSTAADAASYMDRHLGDKVCVSLERCLQEKPSDPIRLVAQSLRELCAADAARKVTHTPTQAAAQRQPQSVAPASVRLGSGVKYELHPLAHDFRRATRNAAATAAGPAPLSVFPAVAYGEALSTYEVAASLRQLCQLDPAAPLVLLVESPAPSAAVFFYEGVPYTCAKPTQRGSAPSPPPSLRALQEALGADKVGDVAASIHAAVAEAATAVVRVVFLPSIQSSYLDAFDAIDGALKATRQATATASPLASPTRAPSPALPSVLFVSYRADTSPLTYARLLASYGPHYEAAQRSSLQAFRAAQLERKRTYTFAYAMEYWAKVQRMRHSSAGASRTLSSPAKSASSVRADDASTGVAAATPPSEAATPSAAASRAGASAGDGKRGAARPAKRGVLAYEAAHQIEDDVFLVVVRRLEHAAATLIQSVFRGHRARCGYAEACAAAAAATTDTASDRPHRDARDVLPLRGGVRGPLTGQHTASQAPLPPLLHACLERLVREGDTFGSLWGNYVGSPVPESRRCWIYRPVQRHESSAAGDVELANATAAAAPAGVVVREGWVQEELLLPPWRATQPRRHLDLYQRLLEYLTMAQCDVLHDSVQLLTDSPGLSVLQRRAYDGLKSVCLSLFHVAYCELRQRYGRALPLSFSAYMRQSHAAVLGWLSAPHECSLLVHAALDLSGTTASESPQQDAPPPTLAERAAARVVQSKLATHEALLVAPHVLSLNGGPAPTTTSASPKLVVLAPQVYLASQPLLPREDWIQAVTAVVSLPGEHGNDVPPPAVEWLTTVPFPLCCIDGAPVAAVPRSDAQKVPGTPPYDAFVPRLQGPPRHTVGTMSKSATATESTAGDTARPSPLPPADVSAVTQTWMHGSLASAADNGLAHHIRGGLSSPAGVVYYRARARHAGSGSGSGEPDFTNISTTAVLARDVLRLPRRDGHTDSYERTACDGSIPPSEQSGSFSAAATPRRRSAERGEGWERVMEAVAQESAAAARRSWSRTSSILTSPGTSVGVLGWSRNASAHASPASGPVVRPLAVLPHVEYEVSNAFGDEDATRVHTVSDVADEVRAALADTSFHHTRLSLRLFAGAASLERLDTFLDSIAAVLQQEAHSPSLVLAVDAPSQGFYALAAALLAFRLHDTRDVAAWAGGKGGAGLLARTPARRGGAKDGAPMPFLSGFHEVLETALPTPNSSRAPVQTTAVQMAVQRVSQLMGTAAQPELNLMARLRAAVREAEDCAGSPAQAIVQATQLAEQYALLVLLDYYLWSSVSSFTPSGASLSSRGVAVRMTNNCAFAAFVSGVPAALEWIARIDPWGPSPSSHSGDNGGDVTTTTTTAAPDVQHLRYSNALRRWDDKHYVCFGAL